MVDPHDEEMRKRALFEWASSRYAPLEGKPIGESWREGVLWFLGNSPRTQAEGRGDSPFMAYSLGWVEKLPNGNYLVADGAAPKGSGTVIEVAPNYDIEWSYGEWRKTNKLSQSVRMAQYLPEKDSYIISDAGNERVIQVDKSSKDVEEELTSIDSGTLREPIARWDWEKGNLLLVDYEQHYFAEVDWTGDEKTSFGVFGTAGSDATHLDTPQGVDMARGVDAIIADHGNDRLITVDAGTAQRIFITPNVRSVHRIYEEGGYPLQANYAVGCPQHLGFLFENSGDVWNWMPLGARFVTISKDLTGIFRRHGPAWELDFRAWKRMQRTARQPWSETFMDSVTLGAGASGDMYPFYTFPWREVTVRAVSTQAATLDIYALRTASGQIWSADIPATWDEYDSVSLSAGVPNQYRVPGGAPTMAAQVTMGGTQGDVSLWISHR